MAAHERLRGSGKNQDTRRDLVSAAFTFVVALLGVVGVGVVFVKLQDTATALTAIFVSALPTVLAWLAYRVITLKSAGRSIALAVPTGSGPTERAAAIWSFERCHLSRCTQSTSAYAILWGASTTLTLAGVLTFHCMEGRGQQIPEICERLTAMVVASMSTCFLVSLTRLMLRIANDDASRRMFAVAFQTTVTALVTTVMLFFAAKPLKIPLLSDASSSAPFIAVGVAIALLGPDLLADLPGRIAPLLGLKLRAEEQGTPLTTLDGITTEEIRRLSEEGITSVEAIAHNPLPRMYFNTGYSLDRICDWHDQALLVSRVGADGAKRLRTLFGIRGAFELRRQIRDGGESTGSLLGHALEGAPPEKIKSVFEAMQHDEMIDLVDVFRRSTLQSEHAPEESELQSVSDPDRDERPRLVK
jgi:hypothetical protein